MTAKERRAELTNLATLLLPEISDRIAKETDAEKLAKYAQRLSNIAWKVNRNLSERANEHLRYFLLLTFNQGVDEGIRRRLL